MSNPVSITDLLTAIGSDNIRFQDVMSSMESIKSKKGATVISFATDAMSPGDVVTGTGPKGLVLWIDRSLMQQRLDELKAGNGLTYDKLLEQHNEMLAALNEITLTARKVGNVAYNLGQRDEQWDSSIYPATKANDAAILAASKVISKAKGGAA